LTKLIVCVNEIRKDNASNLFNTAQKNGNDELTSKSRVQLKKEQQLKNSQQILKK